MTLTTYRNFDLLLTRAGARYRAIVVDAPAGEESVLFDPPFAADALPRLDGLARGVARGAERHIGAADDPGPAADLTGLGSQLFGAIFGGQVGTLLAASLASVAGEGAGLRLRLRFEQDAAELALLPWETLYDPAQGHFVGLGETSPILRYLALPRSRSALPVEPPLRVLALLASPDGLPPLDVEREWQAIQDALAGLVADGKFVLERLASPTLDALQQRLLGGPVHILHFIGHGVFDEAAQAGCLALADVRGRPHLVQSGDLAKLLRNHPAVRLAYLNACEGALASGQSVFTGAAQALVREGVPAAVAMQAEISDPGAIELARVFYTALAAGRPVDAALTQARVALSAAGSGEWAIPVLFSRSPDNRLFDIRQVLPTPDCPYPGMVPFNEAQRDLFFGREREIEEAVERLRQHPFLAIIGPSGSGKSSLIYAGVIPALRRSRRTGAGEWAIKTLRPSDRRTAAGHPAPMQALTELLGLPSQSPVAQLPIDQSTNPPFPTLLFVDQFEELFTLAEADERQAFLNALAALTGQPNLYILLTARADFYPELMACSLWQPIRANRLELPPLGDDELWAAIVEPANRVGVMVDEALAVKLVADAAGERGSLPLVQETLLLLWDKVKERQLRLKAYQEMARDGRSGLQVAIDRRASLVYANLPEAAQPLARRIFLRLVQFGEGRADTRRQQTVEELRASGDDPALFDATLASLTVSRLLTATGEAGDPSRRIDIAHEALIAGWPRLQEWLGQRRAAEQTRRRLEAKA
ncbi:MAG: CHAT domain-containing protein, partial [Chloroflexi bacterium]|nr:CHAT domain-containing protein [Chloroflexota bacterium]